MSRNIRREADRGKCIPEILDPKEFQQIFVKRSRMEIHQSRAGIIGDLGPGLTGQAETDIVLAFKDPFDVVDRSGLVVADPCQKADGLAGHDMLAGEGKSLFLSPIRLPVGCVFPGTVVRGDDPASDRMAVLSP